MFCLITRNDLQYWVRDDQVKQIQEVLESGVKWLKLGDDFINTSDIVGLVNESAIKEKTQRKRGFFQVGNGEWASRYDTQDNWKEPYVPNSGSWDNKKIGDREQKLLKK